MQESDPGSESLLQFLQTRDMSNMHTSYRTSYQHLSHMNILNLHIYLKQTLKERPIRSGLRPKVTWLGQEKKMHLVFPLFFLTKKSAHIHYI